MGLMFEVAEGGFLDIDVRIEGNFFTCNLKPLLASGGTGSKFPGPGRFRVSKSRVRAGYGYYPKVGNRVPGYPRVISGY